MKDFFRVSLALRAARHLRCKSLGAGREAPALTLAQCVVVCFTIELFIRGSGYFGGTTLLLAASVTILSIRPWAPLVKIPRSKRRRRLLEMREIKNQQVRRGRKI